MDGRQVYLKVGLPTVHGSLTLSYYNTAVTVCNNALEQHSPHDLTHNKAIHCACCCDCQQVEGLLLGRAVARKGHC